MILAIDIGNTKISFGVFDEDKLVEKWQISTACDRTSDELGVLLRQFFIFAEFDYRRVAAVIISSVVPAANNAIADMSKNYFGIESVFVDHTFPFGLKILYETPETLGIDRIIAAFAAADKYGTPCIVADFGTATTIDAVSRNNEYLGGIIAPGMTTLTDSLFEKTAKLPRVELAKTASVFGKTTTASIQSGAFYGYTGFVEAIINKMIDELGEKPPIIATGGLSARMAENSLLIDVVDNSLLLEGLLLMHKKIASGGSQIR